jgi:transposase
MPHRCVQRARIILANAEGELAPLVAKKVGLNPIAVRMWLKRFNEKGLAGLEDLPKPGPPREDTSGFRSELAKFARTPPPSLGLPFQVWTMERLQAAMLERTGRRFSTKTLWTWLKKEGLRWRRQQSGLRPVLHTPEAMEEFEEKRGLSSRYTNRHTKQRRGRKGAVLSGAKELPPSSG